MLLRFDPFRDVERLAEEMLDTAGRTPRMMPMDAYRAGDHYMIHFDLPGIDPGSVDLTVEENVLTVRAERTARTEDVQYLVAERPSGTFTRRLVIGDGLDTARVHATYTDGVLTVDIPVAEQAKPRRIDIMRGERRESKVIAGETEPRQVETGSSA